MSFQLGLKIPNSDSSRILAYPHDPDIENSKAIEIGNYSFYMRRLKMPYSDNCIDFEKYNFSNRYHAIYSCFITELNIPKISKYRVVRENDSHLLDHYISTSENISTDCKIYDRDACNEHAIFTKILSIGKYKTVGEPVYRIYVRPSIHPSFRIVSKPRIDGIDIVTYVLGALGSWIGFSFLQMNPFPFLLKIKENNPLMNLMNEFHFDNT